MGAAECTGLLGVTEGGSSAEATAVQGADMGASVKDIFHERAWLQRNVDQARSRKLRARFERTHVEARSLPRR